MKLIGLMPVRNEDWCLGLTLRVALKWCDEVLCYFHACTDDSQRIARECYAENPGRVGFAYGLNPSWDEMQHRQSLLEQARARGATHIALIDADEFLTANLVHRIREVIEGLPAGLMLDLPLYNARRWDQGPLFYHTNGVWGNRWVATAFQDSPELSWKGDRYHHREPFGIDWCGRRARWISHAMGGTIHLWGASERRLRAKHALYRVTERLRWPSKPSAQIEYTYEPATRSDCELARLMGVAVPWEFAEVKSEWINPYADWFKYLHVGKEPWQIAEAKRLVLEHGAEKFHGLDLLGVPEW